MLLRRLVAGLGVVLAGAAALAAAHSAPHLRDRPSASVATPQYPFQDSPYMDSLTSATPGSECDPEHNGYQLQLDHDQMSGMHWAYLFVTWSDIERVPGQYDLSCPDAIVTYAHSRQVNLMMQVQTAGDWVVPGPAQLAATGGNRPNTSHPIPHSAAPMNIDAAMPFWSALLTRYRPGGTLAAAAGWSDGYGVTYYEAENEPDSLAWATGLWETVPKDYALYISRVKATMSSIDPSLHLVAPALAQSEEPCQLVDPQPCRGLPWLDQVLRDDAASLEWGSDRYRQDVQAGQPIVGAGPSVDVYSYHEDNPDVTSTVLADRAAGIRGLLQKYSSQAGYPTNPSAPIWDTEGDLISHGPSSYSKPAYAWGSAQQALELLGAGVARFNFDWSTSEGDTGSTLASDPIFLATKALTSYFPSGQGVTDVSSTYTAAAGQPVNARRWVDPSTGLASVALWAQDESPGSGATGQLFTIAVPVRTANAVVVGADWSQSTVAVSGGSVTVSLQRGDPSPVLMVVEQGALGPSPSPSPSAAPGQVQIAGAMEGNLQIAPGNILRAGYDLSLGSTHPAATVRLGQASVQIPVTCPGGASKAISIPVATGTYEVAAGDPAWQPSPDATAAATWQGSIAAPDLCGGHKMAARSGAVFAAIVASTAATPVAVRFHYSAATPGTWSTAVSVVPAPLAICAPISVTNPAGGSRAPTSAGVSLPWLDVLGYTISGSNGRAHTVLRLGAAPGVSAGGTELDYITVWDTSGGIFFTRLAYQPGPDNPVYDVVAGGQEVFTAGRYDPSSGANGGWAGTVVSGTLNGDTVSIDFPYGTPASSGLTVLRSAAYSASAVGSTFWYEDSAPEGGSPGSERGPGGLPFC